VRTLLRRTLCLVGVVQCAQEPVWVDMRGTELMLGFCVDVLRGLVLEGHNPKSLYE
jgi:hypothetical protein